jgi:hypothetical protein
VQETCDSRREKEEGRRKKGKGKRTDRLWESISFARTCEEILYVYMWKKFKERGDMSRNEDSEGDNLNIYEDNEDSEDQNKFECNFKMTRRGHGLSDME